MRPSASVAASAIARRRGRASTRTPSAGRPRSCRGRGSRGSCRESCRFAALLAAISSSSALTRWPSRTTSSPPTTRRSTRWGAESTSPARDPRAAELETVDPPDGEVRALARLERADVVAAEHGGAAAGAEREGVADGHRRRPAAAAGDEQRLLDLEEEVAPLVRGRAVDAEPDAHVRAEEAAHGRDPAPRRRFDVGQCATPVPVSPKRRIRRRAGGRSAHQTSPASQPSRSRYSTGVQP